jgi:hypothetical protein
MNRWLTKASHDVLTKLLASEEQELTWEKGAGWWTDTERVSAAGCEHLLRLCLIRVVHHDNRESYIVYNASSEVETIMKDENYVPAIVKAQQTGQPQYIGKVK